MAKAMFFKGGPRGGRDLRISAVRIRWGPIISYQQKVGEQKSESKVVKPGHTKRAKRGGVYIYIYIYIYGKDLF